MLRSRPLPGAVCEWLESVTRVESLGLFLKEALSRVGLNLAIFVLHS